MSIGEIICLSLELAFLLYCGLRLRKSGVTIWTFKPLTPAEYDAIWKDCKVKIVFDKYACNTCGNRNESLLSHCKTCFKVYCCECDCEHDNWGA